MARTYKQTIIRQIGNLTNDTPMLELAAHPGDSDEYLYVERIVFCVYEPANPDGICQIKDETDTIIWTIGVDTKKEFTLDFGFEGANLGKHSYLRAIVSGSTISQASVSIAFVGYRSLALNDTRWINPNLR